MLVVEDLRLRYGASADRSQPVALDGLSLTVADGQVVALLGPSGCGKTSLLRLIAGLEVPDAGRIVLDGRDLARVPTHQRGIGLMFQDYALFPHRDVAANVAFGLRMRGDGSGARKSRVAEVLALVGLAGFESRSVSTLSGGERQRVALARALAPSPALLMLDEPLGALDRTLRDRLVMELSELFAELAIGVVYVTHDQAEALALADQVVVMRAGRVEQSDPPDEVWSTPATPFVARFLGLANLFEAAVVDGRADLGWAALAVAAPDGPATVMVRPEAVSWSEEAEEVPGGVTAVVEAVDGPISATVEAVAFRGDHTQVWLLLPDGTRLEARRPGPARPEIGAPVAVCIDPSGVQVVASP